MRKKPPRVFDYDDYRLFLRDYYENGKAEGHFSFRAFSRRAKLGSPNYFKLVMDSQRALTDEMAERFAKACRLDSNEQAYFCTLVRYTNNTDPAKRELLREKLNSYRRYEEVYRLKQSQMEYYSNWYVAAIRELAQLPGFRRDPEWIANTLMPPVTQEQVSNALDILLKLGLLKENADGGGLEVAHGLISTGAETQRELIINYHREMIAAGSRALDSFPAEERDVSALTLRVGENDFPKLKQYLARFRKELLTFAEPSETGARIVQVNLQAFPLCKPVMVDPEIGEAS